MKTKGYIDTISPAWYNVITETEGKDEKAIASVEGRRSSSSQYNALEITLSLLHHTHISDEDIGQWKMTFFNKKKMLLSDFRSF